MSVITINANNDNSAGTVTSQNNNFSTARNAATGSSASAPDQVGPRCGLAAGTFFILRGFLKFSLANIPPNSVINSCKLQFELSTKNVNDGYSLEVVPSTASSSLSTVDFDNVTFTSISELAFASMSTGAYVSGNDMIFNATGLTQVKNAIAGTLSIALIMSGDLNSSAPGAENTSNITGANGVNVPRIVVDYTPPGAGLLMQLT